MKGPSEAASIPFDVRPLLQPQRKYLGAALDGAPRSVAPVQDFAERIGKQPNLLEFYVEWGGQLDAQGVRNTRAAGALPLMVWEPFAPSIKAIAGGATDAYARKFATAVRTLNLPVAISFGHEMNGHWYPWGTRETDPVDFVRAWRRVHDIFLDVGATNVIWVWSPNVINPVPQVRLQPLYPGDSYVDWIGVAGYYTDSGASTSPSSSPRPPRNRGRGSPRTSLTCSPASPRRPTSSASSGSTSPSVPTGASAVIHRHSPRFGVKPRATSSAST